MKKHFTHYVLAEPWTESAYARLLDLAEGRGGFCLLVSRKDADDRCRDWLDANSASLMESRKAIRWPGTRVFRWDDAVTVYKFELTPELLASLRRTVQTPLGWIGPSLPEDLSFLRPDGTPWFVAIAHERDAYFQLASGEIGELESAFGDYSLVRGRCRS